MASARFMRPLVAVCQDTLGLRCAGEAFRSLENSARCMSTQAATSSAASTSATAASAAAHPPAASAPVFAACVLERLPVVLPRPPQWEVEFKEWQRGRQLALGQLKEYPQLATKSEGDDKAKAEQQEGQKLREFVPAPSTTKADASGDKRTMKRQLDQRLYMLVRKKGSEAWQFPMAQHQDQESIRETAERAMLSIVGRRYPIFFIGNAPMAHFPLIPAGGTVFHMLAQVVDDPWDVQLQPASGMEEYTWVTKEEMVAEHFKDAPRMRELVQRML